MNISVEHLSKYYDGIPILIDLTLSIKDIKVVGIIGESGCGKSTLLRQLSGIELPDLGRVVINGMEVKASNLKAYQDNIGMVFQNHSLFPHLSIQENLILILTKIKKLSADEAKKRVDELLQQFHLVEQADKIPSKVSGGQAQRASIARAIATKPGLVFLDEPTAALDPLLTKEVLESIQILKEKGDEFVFVTHELDFLGPVVK